MVTMKKLQQPKGNKGFTLIELMISVCIMAIAFAGLATMQIACINGNSIASNLTIGITLAQDQMEMLNGLDSGDPSLADNNAANNANLDTADCDFTSAITYPAGSSCLTAGANMQDDGYVQQGVDGNGVVNAGGMYTRTWNVANSTPSPGMRTVAVIVTWQNRTHRVSVTSVLN
jgi:prepilin-type N-terminal cleavage/methylation domain-containing protein